MSKAGVDVSGSNAEPCPVRDDSADRGNRIEASAKQGTCSPTPHKTREREIFDIKITNMVTVGKIRNRLDLHVCYDLNLFLL